MVLLSIGNYHLKVPKPWTLPTLVLIIILSKFLILVKWNRIALVWVAVYINTDSFHEPVNICQWSERQKHIIQYMDCNSSCVLSLLQDNNILSVLWQKKEVRETRTGGSKLFCRGPNEYFRLQRTYDFSHSYSTLLLSCEKGHGRHVNEWAWLCSDKILFTKRCYRLIWPASHRCWSLQWNTGLLSSRRWISGWWMTQQNETQENYILHYETVSLEV